MEIATLSATPVISVIIPCYNHGHFLPKALESVLSQNYPAVEVVVVDDGSTDTTRQVAARYPQVRYHYQPNQGLSAARNAGIRCSSGQYLVFLDADDWLYPGALQINARYLQQHQHAAFVSGAYDNVYMEDNEVKEVKREVLADHYHRLLQTNYVGVPASVMYRRWVFDEFLFDSSLKTCEDYDMYLRIARKYPIIHHTEKVAAYCKHASNMSSNIPAMLSGSLKVLGRQKKQLVSDEEKMAYKKGVMLWKKYYCSQLYKSLLAGKTIASATSLYILGKYKPMLIIKYMMMRNYYLLKSLLKHKPQTASSDT